MGRESGYKAVNNKETLPQKKAKGKNHQLRLSSDLHVRTVTCAHLRAHTKQKEDWKYKSGAGHLHVQDPGP